MFSFNFLGKDSYADFGIVIEKRPIIPKAQRNIQYIEVPGKSGSLKVDDTTYKDIVIPVQCSFKDDNVADKADAVKAWLDSGEGSLILSNQPDKYYIAHVSDQVDISQEFKVFGKFLVNFRCQPFKYNLPNDVITLTEFGTVINIGTINSEPIIVVTGSGNITLTINEVDILLTAVDGHITIDSVLKDAYKDTILQNSMMLGDFPVLQPGDNGILWSGTGVVTKVEITPNWRWL
ncbi:MAG: distal tail protein Dit [Desulfitobacteriaceae bacterium]